MNLIYLSLIFLIYLVLKSKIKFFSFGIFTLFFLLGTFIHELSHFLMAKILFVPVGNFSLFPKFKGRIIELGSVTVAKTDLIRGSLIGLAPLFISLAGIYYLYFLPISVLNVFLILQCFHIGGLSFSDIKSTLKLILIILVILLIFVILNK